MSSTKLPRVGSSTNSERCFVAQTSAARTHTPFLKGGFFVCACASQARSQTGNLVECISSDSASPHPPRAAGDSAAAMMTSAPSKTCSPEATLTASFSAVNHCCKPCRSIVLLFILVTILLPMLILLVVLILCIFIVVQFSVRPDADASRGATHPTTTSRVLGRCR